MSDFKIKFRGTRGSYPTPDSNFLKFGGHTACIEVNIGGNLIILDSGYGIINLGKDLYNNYLSNKTPINATILLSHIHQDHIQGLPFFKPIYMKSTKLNIYGLCPKNYQLKDILSEVLFGKTFPLGLDEVEAKVNIENFIDNMALILNKNQKPKMVVAKDLENIKLNEDDVIIQTHKTNSHPKDGSLSYKIQYKDKTLVYATDKECNTEENNGFWEFANSADVLIHDSQYTTEEYNSEISPKNGFGHSTFEMAIEEAKHSNAKKLIFFHYAPDYDDKMLANLEEKYLSISPYYNFAKENLEITL